MPQWVKVQANEESVSERIDFETDQRPETVSYSYANGWSYAPSQHPQPKNSLRSYALFGPDCFGDARTKDQKSSPGFFGFTAGDHASILYKEAEMIEKTRRLILAFAVVIVAGSLTYGGWRLLGAWRYRTALSAIQADVQAGRHSKAARKLVELLAWKPDSDEAAYLLGVCEKARGRTDAASEAWARIPPGSRFAAGAVLGRAALEVDRGRLADAEQLLNQALEDPRIDGLALRRFLAPLYWQEGRLEEASRLIEADWDGLDRAGRGGSDRAIELVRLHVALSVGMASAEAVRGFLERAATLAPQDDRIWLGRANLAIRQGAFDEAQQWLDSCSRRRPRDLSVWRSRLAWALASGRVATVRDALAHLPAKEESPAQVQRLAAWFARHRGDISLEQIALERLIALDPEDGAARDRLVELAIREGQPAVAAELRRRKSELDQVKLQYQSLFRRDQPARDAAEMARLAEQLGRVFEAKVFWSIALRQEPSHSDLQNILTRLRQPEKSPGEPGQSLAELLARDLDLAVDSSDRQLNRSTVQVDSSTPVLFQDDAGRARLSHVFENGESSVHQVPEVSSGGIGLIDFDGDGWLDVYAVQGGPFPPRPGNTARGDRLFRNRRDGSFEDATTSSGLSPTSQGYGHGVAVGDYNNDGHADLFITRWRSYALYRNQGDGTFKDVTIESGLGGDRDWPTSAAWADLDNDGDLDLYVCHYLKWDADHPPVCAGVPRQSAISCDPSGFPALPDHVFRNDGGRFTDVTTQAGCIDRDGRGFGVVAVDVDDDNRVDLFIANDMSANYLFRNLGDFRFAEQGLLAGVACNAHGGNQAGMGVAAGDLDNDARLDLAVTNFFNESTTLFHNLGNGQFVDHAAAAGLALPSRDRLGFGIAFLDADNDGWLDLMTANGHVNNYQPDIPYRMPIQLLLGGRGGQLSDVSARAGPPFLVPHIGRGLAVGDVDNDGRVDALVVAHNEPLVYLHNQTVGGHFLTIALEGTTSNRDGVRARVTVESSGSRQVAQRLGGGSFLSANDPRLRFGLGRSTGVDRLEIRWPSGKIDQFRDLKADKGYHFREGDSQPAPLPGW